MLRSLGRWRLPSGSLDTTPGEDLCNSSSNDFRPNAPRLAAAGSPARVYGGVDLQDVILSHPNARALDRVLASGEAPAKRSTSGGLGGPEGSRFLRLELSITELARELDLDAA